MARTQNWLDRAIGLVAPSAQLRRTRARIATDLVLRHYEAAAVGRRTQGWTRTSGDANAVNGPAVGRIRDLARDLVRNDRQIKSAVRTIANHTVGWGIVAKPIPVNPAVLQRWQAWADSTACDADERHDLYGLQKLIMRGVAESGEMLVRRRVRRLEDGYPIPLQLQVLEPDLLDTAKTQSLPNNGQILQGVEFGPLGERVAYWLFQTHPGATGIVSTQSRRIPASEVLHIYDQERAGQVRGISWLACEILPVKELGEYTDAQLMKQKIAACLAVIMSDVDGSGAALGTPDDTTNPGVDMLEPGAIIQAKAGQSIEVVQPPAVNEYDAFTKVENRANAKGLGLSYEDFTGDYSNVNFSSARMARLEHYENVYDWRWRMLVPQFCDPVWKWAMQALQILGTVGADVPAARWSAPPIPMIEPDKEGLAIMRIVRTGLQSWSDAVRERGYDPDELLAEMASDNTKFDELGIVLDSDPRKMTQQGQFQTGDLARQPGATGNGGSANG